MGMKALQIQAWALEADRSHLAEKQTVQLSFDALPGSIIDAQISHIASAPGPRASWGNGRYFKVDIALPAGLQLKLVPGMSVLIEPKKRQVLQHRRRAGSKLRTKNHSLISTLKVKCFRV